MRAVRALLAIGIFWCIVAQAWTLIVIAGASNVLPLWTVLSCVAGLLISGGTLLGFMLFVLVPERRLS